MATAKQLSLANLEQYHLFALIETLYKLKAQDIDNLLKQTANLEVIDFSGDNSLAFALRDISSVTMRGDKFALKVPFMNLIGAHSPLPNYYLNDLALEELQDNKPVTELLNLFNHRLITLLYKIWRKYRYFVCFKTDGDDEFSRQMFALIGLESKEARSLLQVNPSKMLSYIGILTNSARSPQLIATLVASCFELSNVTIGTWQMRRVSIAPQQLNALGQNNCVLNKNFILGGSVIDYKSKFILTIRDLTLKRMQSFLPNGHLHKSLVNFVTFIMREQLAWDLCLVLAPKQINRISLGIDNGCYLGWTTFLGNPPRSPQTTITIS